LNCLAITDLLKVLLSGSMSLASVFKSEWLFGQMSCNIHGIGFTYFAYTNMAILVLMSLERFIVVKYPFKMTTLSTKIKICKTYLLNII